MKILLITPPLLQPNTPYAATPLLTAWLKSLGHDAVQADLSLELLLRLYSADGLRAVAREAGLEDADLVPYLKTISTVMAYLQDKAPELAGQIARRGYLPEGPALEQAYAQEEQLGWNFRGTDEQDRAKHLAALYLDDLADLAAEVDPHFGFSRYAEKLAASLPDFQPMQDELESSDSLFMQWLRQLSEETVRKHSPELVALTIPFPGCLFGALVIAREIRRCAPGVHITLGGGYVNTELRELKDPGIFTYVDSISLDSGLLPLARLAHRVEPAALIRTFICKEDQVLFCDAPVTEVEHNELPAPDFTGLRLDDYFSLFESLNPFIRLWSDGRWNKLALAHGCCWSRCAFCDTSIDYIKRYDPSEPTTICDWIESVIEQTGFRGFHFVDEALPPQLLDVLCDELLCRGLQIEWWGNIRFEKRFSTELIRKMADAGCIAVSGGLETCNDRTLKLMQKGITLEHASRVLNDCAEAGILTHAYLMYGFPTQTYGEIVETLETVRQLFDYNILHSAYWHRFALTAHSPMSLNPEAFGIRLAEETPGTFARNEIPFDADFDYDPIAVGEVLDHATYNFRLGLGLDRRVDEWFMKLGNC